MSPHDPFLKQMYEEKLRGAEPPPQSNLSNSTKAVIMARRLGLPGRLGTEIFMMTLKTMSYNTPDQRMVVVANAIKYAADHKAELKPQWRVGT